MAYHFSKYVNEVASAGKVEYLIPLYITVWLNFDSSARLDLRGLPPIVGGGSKPGDYPSEGAVPHAFDIWIYNTPALDFIAPDLYARRVWLAAGT
jgi:hypothetical protein